MPALLLVGGAVAATPGASARMAYVANQGSDEVIPVDLASGTALGPITTGGDAPLGIAITPDGSRAYVANSNSDNVTPITLASGTAGTPIPVGDQPVAIAITPDGSRAYVANASSDDVTPITLAAGTAGTPIPVGDQPVAIAITPDGSRAFVTNLSSGDVTPVDIAADSAGGPIASPSQPRGIAIMPNGARAYVANGANDRVTPIDVPGNAAGTPIPVLDAPQGVAVAPSGSTVYVTGVSSTDVTPISTATDTTGAAISVGVPGDQPRSIAIVPDQGPRAAFSVVPAPSGKTTAFSGTGSSDPDGAAVRFDWDFGDGASLPNGGPTPTHRYSRAGTYTVTLAVTDDEGCSAGLVFTGQTASCAGSPQARISRLVTVTSCKKLRRKRKRQQRRLRDDLGAAKERQIKRNLNDSRTRLRLRGC